MAVSENRVIVDNKDSKSPQERWVIQRYGMKELDGKKKKARSIHELYKLRYKEKFR